MKAIPVKDGQKVKPNTIYIVPPNMDLAILNGALQLLVPINPAGPRMPIDYFFRTLAEDQGDKAICIILSGMGTDGTLGLRAIKGELGMTMVQNPDSAKYDSMPRSAIRTNLVDYILPPEEMPEQLTFYTKHTLRKKAPKRDFSEAEISIESLFRELLIGVTNFFRDNDAFIALNKTLLKKLETKPKDYVFRVWVPGCSSGEEAYSIAIILRECIEQLKQHVGIQIFATDIDENAIKTARAGVYPESISIDVSPERLKRFFVMEEHIYQVKKEVREVMVFAPQNIIKDPPFTKLDLAQLAERTLLETYAPASVVIEESGEILYIHGATGKYLELASGEPKLDAFEMARQGLKVELSSAVRKAATKHQEVVYSNLEIAFEGRIHKIKLTVKPIRKFNTSPQLFLVAFEDLLHPVEEKPSSKKQISKEWGII